METLSNENEEYSEWRLLHSRGLRGSSFETVVVNEGFQNKDFQTNQGVFSVIDPEILGKLRKEASTIRNETVTRDVMSLFILFLVLVSFHVLLDMLIIDLPDEAMGSLIFASLCLCLILGYASTTYPGEKENSRLSALVDSYKPVFHKEYGVELGYGKFSSSPQGGGCFKVPGIYLRRPHRMVDEEQARVVGTCDDLNGGRFPPIYVNPLIPGEIVIDEKVYDAASMKVNAEIWTLLQSTHQKMVQWHPMLKLLAILCYLGLYVGCLWTWQHIGFVLGLVISNVYIFIVFMVYERFPDRLNLRACEETTKVVNEALRMDKDTAHLTVEFQDSNLPGREGRLCHRYQFVEHALAPTRNKLV